MSDGLAPSARALQRRIKAAWPAPIIGRISRLLRRHTPGFGRMRDEPNPDLPEGVSAVMRVKGNAPTLPFAVASIAPHVKEILVIHSSPLDLESLRAAVAPHDVPIQSFDLAALGLPDIHDDWDGMTAHSLMGEIAARYARFRWTMKWDDDMIAQNAGPHTFAELLARLAALPRRYRYRIEVPLINIAGDYQHVNPAWRLQTEAYFWTSSRHLHCEITPKYPLFVLARAVHLRVHMTAIFHFRDACTDEELYARQLWPVFRKLQPDSSLAAWAIEQHGSSAGLAEAARQHITAYTAKLEPYDGRFGPLPDVVREMQERFPIGRMA